MTDTNKSIDRERLYSNFRISAMQDDDFANADKLDLK